MVPYCEVQYDATFCILHNAMLKVNDTCVYLKTRGQSLQGDCFIPFRLVIFSTQQILKSIVNVNVEIHFYTL